LELGNQEVELIIQKAKAVSVVYLFSGNRPINRRIPAAIKDRLENAKGTKCPLCPNILVFTSDKSSGFQHLCEASPDHILDRVLGGNNTESNFFVICYQCNRAKNHAMLNHLKTTSPGTTPGTNRWREIFRSKPENIVKLFDYIDWSYRLPYPQKEQVDSTLQGYFDENRFRNETPPEMHETSIVDYLGTPAELSDLERRIQRPENTLWKRTMRVIGSFFQRVKSSISPVEKASTEKKASNPQKGDSHNLDFTPEEFSRGLLSHKKRAEPVTFATLLSRLIKEDPRFNLKLLGIKPSVYLLEYCSHLLEIEGREKGKEIHYWINKKENPVKIEASFDVEKVTPELDGVDKFKRIIMELLSNSNNKISISALGLKFTKKVQSLGFDNKKEFFKQVGIRPNITISTAINEYMSEEVTLEDDHASLNRRD
jgi:5-methylcytosine-specific restriction endonuclease McrA